MTEKQLPFQNATINYSITGKGNAVMLLHGFAEDRTIWDSYLEKLSTHYTLIVPDIPGSGKSTMIVDEKVGLEDYAECIHLILAKENIEECCIIGHSMGGYIALAFAEKYAELVSGLGLFHSSAYADDENKKQTRQKAILFIKENTSLAFLKTSIPGLFSDPFISQDSIDYLIERGKQFSPEALIQYYQAMIDRPDRTAVLKNSSCPVMFIMGKQDKAVPFEFSLQQCHLPTESHITVLRESAHMGMIEENEKSFKTLADFLHSVYV